MKVNGVDHPDTASTAYALACIAARSGRKEDAIALLRQGLDHGLRPAVAMGIPKDVSLVSLHGDPGFQALLMRSEFLARKQPPGAAQKE